MIPNTMKHFLLDVLPEPSLNNRLIQEDSRRYLEFGPLDVDQLARLGIVVDSLGPRLVACMWDEDSPLEIGGYLVVDNLAMGKPSMGGIRMLPDISPAAIYNLARGMTLKNAAAQLPYGGGKTGIIGSNELSPSEHTAVVQGFARLLGRYVDIYLPGPDVGTNDSDLKTIAIENGLDNALSKPVDMGGNRIDELGAAAGGTIIALDELLKEMPKLRVLPQFGNLQIPSAEALTVLIQGFGAVGAHGARILGEMLPGVRITGISDFLGCLYDTNGLPITELFARWVRDGLVTRPYYLDKLAHMRHPTSPKFMSDPNDLLRESAFCLIPAAPIANYLDTDPATKPSMTTSRMGNWAVIVEGANTYSPDPARKSARARMERVVYRERGTLIATDYLVNSGGVIYAAQEHLIKTPHHLRIPAEMLGNRQAVDRWLAEHESDLAVLAEQRLQAAEAYRDKVIRRNMRELIDLLVADADMLPCEAAERISIRRIAARESDRTVSDIMDPVPTIPAASTVLDAALLLVQGGSSIIAVVNENAELVGVVTDWDITQATAQNAPNDTPLVNVMTRKVISVCPEDKFLAVIRKLEHHDISAMPVVENGTVLGKISTNLLAKRSLYRLLQSESAT